MNQREFTEAVYKFAQKSNHGSPDLSSYRAADRIVREEIRLILDTIKRGETIHISGIGSLGVVRKEARKGVNPRTGEKIKIKAKNAVKYRPGSAMKQAAAKAKIAKK